MFLREFNPDLNAYAYFKYDECVLNKHYLAKSYKLSKLYEIIPSKIEYLLTYKLNDQSKRRVLDIFKKNKLNCDFLIYANINNILDKSLIQNDTNSFRLNSILKCNVHDLSPDKYLDIGCHNGELTNHIAEFFKLDKKNIYGIDIKDYNANLENFSLYDGTNIPFEDNKFDLITCLMVLHHVANIEKFVKDLFRITNKNGIVIIREHDACDKNQHLLLDALHEYHDNVINVEKKWVSHNQADYTCYKSINEWRGIFLNNGFHEVNTFYKNTAYNPFNNFTACFIKK